MKKLFYALLILTPLLFITCKKDGPKNTSVTIKGKTTNTSNATNPEISVGYQTEYNQFTVTAPKDWSLIVDSKDKHWIKVYPTSGKGETIIDITTTPTKLDKERVGKIILSSGEEKINISIKQEAKPSDPSQVIYELPLIFHVLENKDSKNIKNITTPNLQKIVDLVNKKYQLRTSIPTSQDIGVKFILAKTDNKGKPLKERGINRLNWNKAKTNPTDIIGNQESTSVGRLWDLNKFINVFLFEFDHGEDDKSMTLGIANLPIIPEHHPIDGLQTWTKESYHSHDAMSYTHCVVINSEIFNLDNISTEFLLTGDESFSFSTMDVVCTLAHELGHYLGLHHVFSEEDIIDEHGKSKGLELNSCLDTDFCSDTHTYNRSLYMEDLDKKLNELDHELDLKQDSDYAFFKSLFDRSNCDNQKFQSTNLMDYSFCLNHGFTLEQKKRIRHVLNYGYFIPGPKYIKKVETRSTLVPDLEPRTVICPDVPILNIKK